MKIPTIANAIVMMEGGLANRAVDCTLYCHARAGIRRSFEDDDEEAPDFVPRYTQEPDKAMVLLSNIAPYASWRIEYDAMQSLYNVTVLGQRASGAGLAPTICHALLKHIHQRSTSLMGRIRGRLETATVMDGRNARPPSRGPLAVAADYALIEKRARAHMACDLSAASLIDTKDGVLRILAAFTTPGAAECALKLRDRAYLTAESSDDDWCSAMSAYGFAPRDLLPELEAIKKAVFAMRGAP